MAATCYEDRIKQTCYRCSSIHELAQTWSCFSSSSTTKASHTSPSLDFKLLPQCPSSLKGIARFQHYESVWKILLSLKRGGNPKLEFQSSTSKFRAMQEVMEVLFFETVIEDLLIESGFYSHYIHLHGNELLVTIMVYDFQKYKFLFRLPKQTEGIPEKMLRVATALWEHKVKLNATWSRMRVTASAQSPVQLLPVKKLEQFYSICTAPLYCRVMSSQKGITWTSLSVELGKLGISLVSTPGQITSGRLLGTIISEGLLTLSPECRQIIYSSSITQGRMFLPQDFCSNVCIGKLTTWFKSLSESKKDVIITNSDKGGAIVNHISSLIDNGESKIFMFEVTPIMTKTLEDTLMSMTARRDVQMMSAQFKHANPADEIFANVGIIFCNPPNSLSAIKQPIDYIMQDGEENATQLLKLQRTNAMTLEREQADTLSRALKFTQVKHVAYFTRSNLDKENDNLVRKVMKEHVDQVEKMKEQEWAGFALDSDPTFKHKDSNGFLCSFKPNPPKPVIAADVITKAIKLGILDPTGLDYNTVTGSPKTKKKSNKKRIFSQYEGIPLTFSAKQKVVPRQTKKSTIATDFNKQPKPFL